MDNRIDLDQAAGLLARHVQEWRKVGLVADALTWRDIGEPWPFRIKVDRSAVIDADSVGVSAKKGGQEGRLVLYRGGWADIEHWSSSDKPTFEALGTDDPLSLDDFDRVLDHFAGLFGED